ncbi:MAG TPA: hypothetical protein VFU02_05510 [Polyangiaceae bacterium]|nr:hypothetical protein [Polyangiaceae bacterium]
MTPRLGKPVALLRLAATGGLLVHTTLALAEPVPPSVDRTPSISLEKASAPLSYSIEVIVLHATNSGTGIDKRVGDMPELKKPPFSAYDSYELLAKQRMPLLKGQPQTYRLPNDRLLKTDLKEDPKAETFKISASINQPQGKAFLPLLEVKAGLGQLFFVAGQTYKAGILVLVLRVVKD